MAQLPPKVPNMAQHHHWPSCSSFPHHHSRLPSLENLEPNMTTAAAAAQNILINPSWVDEFLDFSSAKRGSHRRSVSDSIAFLELPNADEPHQQNQPVRTGFDHRFDPDEDDDDQFMSMFTEEVVAAATVSSNPSSPSDPNSMINNDDHKERQMMVGLDLQQMKINNYHESDEDQSSCKSEGTTTTIGNKGVPAPAPYSNYDDLSKDKIVDPKRVKRILANRQSAQRSRVRKLQYISELERSVTSLQGEVSVLSPRVAYLDHQRLVLNVDNNVLKQRIAALAQDKLFKDAHQEALKREIERLRQVYYQQQSINNKKMENGAPPLPPSQPPPSSDDDQEKEELLN